MKRICISSTLGLIFSVVVLSFSFVSCDSNNGNEPTKLSASQVTKLVTSYMKEHQVSPAYTQFSIGRFRCDDKDAREVYRKLEAAGVISLKIDTTHVTRTVKTGTDWWTGKAQYSKKNQTMFTLTTELTEETRKYLVENNPFKQTTDPDMDQPSIGDYPEFHLDEVVFDTPDIEEGEDASKIVYAKGTEISLVKVRNIMVDPESKDSAWFECILQNGKVTPAYRVIEKSYDDQKTLMYGELHYFVDKGWTIVGLSNKKNK